MKARAMTVNSTTTSATPCGCGGGCSGNCGCGSSSGSGQCGCAPQCSCDTRCCELECLVRPNFFCGQLLTDSDLAAMVEWTRKRFALARYRDGWGVVCGLDLTCTSLERATTCCGALSKGAPVVYLTPGYAIDCCGNDLVVCGPLAIDLTSACRPPDDPCDPVPREKQPADRPHRREPADGCFDIDPTDLIAVQVSLRYHEDLAQGQRAMFQSGKCNTASCEYARVLERPCVHLQVVPLTPERDWLTPEQEWERHIRAALNKQLETIRTALRKGPPALLQYLKRYPPFRLCFMEETVCCVRDRGREEYTEAVMVQLGMLLLMDWLAREAQCTCFACRPDEGVPLGAVLLRRYTDKGQTYCKVIMIDVNRRFRRPLRPQPCQLVQEGRLGLTQFFGQPAREVASQLHEMKIELKPVLRAREGKLDEFLELAQDYAFSMESAAGKVVRAHVCTDPLGTERIVGFTTA